VEADGRKLNLAGTGPSFNEVDCLIDGIGVIGVGNNIDVFPFQHGGRVEFEADAFDLGFEVILLLRAFIRLCGV
jgi:hypothetical protein